MPHPIKLLAFAAALALPAAANAMDKPPTQPVTPPVTGGGSGGGSPTQVPEPESMLLFGVAAAGLFAARRLHRR